MTEFFGHFHVLLVHLPIGILMIACVFQWLEKKERFSSFNNATNLAFLIGMICAILSAITGYLLSLNGDYDTQLVITHQWFGISVAAVAILMYYLHNRAASALFQYSTSVVLFFLIIITGHLGGSLTHGADYLTAPAGKNFDSLTVVRPIPNVQEAVAYSDIIQPILQTKCYSCHGPHKQKGKLRMDDSLHLMKGGKDGLVLVPGNLTKSELIRRISLPRGDDDHMPPKEKPQLSEEQIALLHWWIESGTPFSKKVKEMAQPADIRPALLALQNEPKKKTAIPYIPPMPVPKADGQALLKLTAIGAVVEPVAQNTNYLSANFVLAPQFSDSQMHLLLPLKEQLIELKLGHTEITDSALKTISQFANIMRLQLDHTRITDKGLPRLNGLQNLRNLNLVGTHVTADGVMQLKTLRNLQSIYLYQTDVNKGAWIELKRVFPRVLIDSGGYAVPLLPTDTVEVKPPTVKK